ncbi:response regulator transcription factor [bacterium]|nr:response regulator transcription factor [bacterium]
MTRVLIVEDDYPLVKRLQKLLSQITTCDYQWAGSCRLAQNLLLDGDFDLVILDRQLPDGDGLKLLERSYGATEASHYLVLSAWGKQSEREEGLLHGAFDYLAKPFSQVEFLEKTKRILAASGCLQDKYIRIGQKVIFLPRKRLLIVDGKQLRLAAIDSRLLEFLTQNEMVTREELRAEIWENDERVSENAISASIARIRRKLGEHAHNLRTLYRLGYQLNTVKTAMIDTRMI